MAGAPSLSCPDASYIMGNKQLTGQKSARAPAIRKQAQQKKNDDQADAACVPSALFKKLLYASCSLG